MLTLLCNKDIVEVRNNVFRMCPVKFLLLMYNVSMDRNGTWSGKIINQSNSLKGLTVCLISSWAEMEWNALMADQ